MCKLEEKTLGIILASKSEDHQRLIEESVDLIYHLMAPWSINNLTLDQAKKDLAAHYTEAPDAPNLPI